MEYSLQITTAALHITILVLNMANNTLYREEGESRGGEGGEGEGRGEGRGGEGREGKGSDFPLPTISEHLVVFHDAYIRKHVSTVHKETT